MPSPSVCGPCHEQGRGKQGKYRQHQADGFVRGKWQSLEKWSTRDDPMNRKGHQRHDGIRDSEGHDQECGDRAAGHESPDATPLAVVVLRSVIVVTPCQPGALLI